MSSPEMTGPSRSGTLRQAGLAFMVIWGVGILLLFLGSSRGLVAPLGGFFLNLGLITLSVWAFMFTGWRCMRLVRRWLPGELDPLEETTYELGAGLGLAVAAMFVLGVLGLYSWWSAVIMLVAMTVGNPVSYWRALRERVRLLGRCERKFELMLMLMVGGMTLLESLAPATSQDALVYHLAIPAQYLRAGGMVYIPGNFFASFPQNVEMLFTLGLLLHDSPLANFYHWLLGAGSVIAIAALARRLASGGGMMAAAIFATIPTVALIAAWAYVDLGLVFFQVTAVLAFMRWWTGTEKGWLILAALHAGLAAGCKYTGATMGILLGVAIFFEGALAKRHFGRTLGRFAVFGGLAFAVASPWYIKNMVLTGNPLHPFMHAIFGGRDWDSTRAYLLAEFLGEWGKSEGLLGLLTLPLELTFTARFFSMENFDGFIGPAFLLACPLVFIGIFRSRSIRLIALLTLGLVLFWVVATRQVRFLVPALACLAAVLGASHALCREGLVKRAMSWCLLAAFAFNTLVITTHFAAHNPIPVVLGLESEEIYLTREVPGGDFPLFNHLNKTLPEDACILFAASGNPGYLCQRDFRSDAIFENYTLEEILTSSHDADAILEEFRNRGYTHLLFRWDLVFDPEMRRSDIPLAQQVLLQEFLNRHCQLDKSVNGTFLYAVGKGSGALNDLEKGMHVDRVDEPGRQR